LLQHKLTLSSSENIIMACVKKGLSRQDAHEEIRKLSNLQSKSFSFIYRRNLSNTVSSLGVLSHQAADNVKKQGKDNDLLDRIRRTAFFNPIIPELDALLDARTFVGRAPEQVQKFTTTEVAAALKPYAAQVAKAETSALHV
jgi:adenylosuccinate lyase